MFKNIGLKIKVFLFIAIVFASLSVLDFAIFQDFLKKNDLQAGAKNAFNHVKVSVKNHQFSLIKKSFELSNTLKISYNYRSKKFSVKEPEKKPTALYSVLDFNGDVVSGTFKAMNSYSGVPVVERAIKQGVASDGYLTVGDDTYLLGAVPKSVKLKNSKSKNVIIITAKRVSDVFKELSFSLPVQVYSGKKLLYQNEKEEWLALFTNKKYGDEVKGKINTLLEGDGTKEVDKWTTISSSSLPFDVRREKISFVCLLSYMPGYQLYNRAILYVSLFAAAAILISFIFSLIVTHEIDKVFDNLSRDLSHMKVGEKLVMHKYSHGASTVVSAVNHLISKYQKHGETNPGIMLNSLLKDEDSIEPEDSSSIELSSASNDKQEITGVSNNPLDPIDEYSLPAVPDVGQAPPAGNIDQEKTQLANFEDFPDLQPQTQESADPFEELWSAYSSIKKSFGEEVPEKDKESFIAKLKKNRASIISKYGCKDVTFSIEVKGGKPVVKAKPVK